MAGIGLDDPSVQSKAFLIPLMFVTSAQEAKMCSEHEPRTSLFTGHFHSFLTDARTKVRQSLTPSGKYWCISTAIPHILPLWPGQSCELPISSLYPAAAAPHPIPLLLGASASPAQACDLLSSALDSLSHKIWLMQ